MPIGQERQGGEILNLMMDGRSKELEWCCITAVLTISRILASDDGGKMPKRTKLEKGSETKIPKVSSVAQVAR